MLPHRSSIHVLPSEILALIFQFTTFSCEDYSAVTLALLAITHTSRRWRSVALSTGDLWTSIVMHCPNTPAQYSRIQTWISRGKACAHLDLLLDFRDENWDWEDEDSHSFTSSDMKTVLDLLSPHVERWRQLKLLADTWAPIHTFLSLTSGVTTLPELQTIALSRCNEYFVRKGQLFQPTTLKEPISLFGGVQVPKLREVSLVGVHVAWSSSRLCNLLELELKYHAFDVMPSLQEFLDILTVCPDLRRLSISGWGPRLGSSSTEYKKGVCSNTSRTRRYVNLSKVTHFALGFVDVEYVLELLPLLQFSGRLMHLEFEDLSASVEHSGLIQDASPVLDFLARSATNADSSKYMGAPDAYFSFPLSFVKHLELRSLHASEDAFLSFFKESSSVEQISLFDTSPNLLAALGPRDDFSPPGTLIRSISLAPCPQLVDMVCRRVDTKMLCAMVAARARAGPEVQPLRRVQLVHDGAPEEDDDDACSEDDLRTLVDSGVNVHIVSWSHC